MTFLNISIKLLKYFGGTTIFAPSFFPFASSATVSPIQFDLYLNDEGFYAVRLIEAPLLSIGRSSLLNCHKLSEVSE